MFAKRLFAIAAFFCLSAIIGCGGQEEQAEQSTDTSGKPHFREARWGMVREEVGSTETAEADPENTDEIVLAFKDQLMDRFDCKLFYTFSDEDQLVAAGYEMDAAGTDFCGETNLTGEDLELANKMKAVDFFNEMKKNLITQYGQPSEDNKTWYSSSLEAQCDYDAKIGYARDAVYLTTRWVLGETIISQVLTKGNFKLLFIKR